MMVFVHNTANKQTKKSPPREKHFAWADRLSDALVATGAVDKLRARAKNAEEFRLLNNFQTDKEIERALQWVIKNLPKIRRREKGLPPVFSAWGFRERFNWVLDCVAKEKRTVPQKEVSPEATRLAGELGQTMGWPKDSRDQLQGVVQKTMDNAKKYIRRLQRALAKLNNSDRKFTDKVVLRRMITAALTPFHGSHADFARSWLSTVNRRVRNWKEWSGNLGYYVWTPNHKDFDTREVFANTTPKLVAAFHKLVGSQNEKPDSGD